MTSQKKELSELREKVGQRIREERLRKNQSLVQLGHKTRLKPKTIDCLEMGRGNFNPHLILRIAAALKVPLFDFIRPG